MVYSGKPSKACERCRKRRMKCDLTRPGCKKCKAAKTTCPGYRDQADLLFRDQTQTVIQKWASHSNLTFEEDISISTPSVSDRDSLCSGTDLALPCHNLKIRVPDAAVAFFMATYLKNSSFDYVPSMYNSRQPKTTFSLTAQATALAAFSHETNQPSLMVKARQMYNEALLQLREDVLAPSPSLEDETVASILLMSRFELLSRDGNEHSITQNWSNHTFGAFTIVKLRGPERNFQSSLSRSLVQQTIRNYNLYCVRKCLRRPPELLDLSNYTLRNSTPADDPLSQSLWIEFQHLSEAFSLFHYSRHQGIQDVSDLIVWAQEIDTFADAFSVKLAKKVKYKTVTIEDRHQYLEDTGISVFDNHYHIYENYRDARIWNGVRMIRLALYESMHILARPSNLSKRKPKPGIVNESGDGLDSVRTLSAEMMLQLVNDICASAPQFLRRGHVNCTHAAGYSLTWPLFVAGRAAPELCSSFAKDRLDWIGQELKIPGASIAAKNLFHADYRDDWLHACYLF